MSNHPLYKNFKFPEYQFHEYPKWVTPSDGSAPFIDYGPGDEEPASVKVEALPHIHEVDPQKPRRGRPPKGKS